MSHSKQLHPVKSKTRPQTFLAILPLHTSQARLTQARIWYNIFYALSSISTYLWLRIANLRSFQVKKQASVGVSLSTAESKSLELIFLKIVTALKLLLLHRVNSVTTYLFSNRIISSASHSQNETNQVDAKCSFILQNFIYASRTDILDWKSS